MTATIYHNPACGTSRNALAILRASGEEPRIVLYLETPPDRTTLMRLIADAGLIPREALRVKGNEALVEELGLSEPSGAASDDSVCLIEAMLAHPILINRPFVVTDLGTALARPSERVADLLSHPVDHYTKEDGEIVILVAGTDGETR